MLNSLVRAWELANVLKLRMITIQGAQFSPRLSEEICFSEGFLEATAGGLFEGSSARVLLGSAGFGEGIDPMPATLENCWIMLSKFLA